MKNIVKFIVLAVVGVLFVASCQSKPETKPQPQPQPPPTPVVVEEVTPVKVEEVKQVVENTTAVDFTEYTVKKGDTLSQIAEKFYGSKDRAYFFPIIVAYTFDSMSKINVSSDSVSLQIADPDVIEPGTVLRIPDFDAFMASTVHVTLVKPLFEKFAVRYENKGRSGVAKMLRERANRLGK